MPFGYSMSSNIYAIPLSTQPEFNLVPLQMVVEGQIETGATEATTLGVCRSTPQNSQPLTTNPQHEAVGQVIEVGSTARDRGFKKGDYIGFINAYHACFACDGCKNHYIYCTSGTMTMQGFACNGFFQEYCAIDSGVAVVLPSGMDPAVSAPIFCAGITSYQAVRTAALQPSEWLAVIGCGGLGQLGIRYAVAMGYKVIAIDIDEKTLQTATESGALHTFNSRSDKTLVDKILDITGGGCHATTVFAAVKAGYDTAPAILRVGGKLVAVGIAKADIQLSTFDLTMRKYYLIAANNSATPKELKDCAEFTAKHKISSPSVYFKLEQIGEMIETMQKEKMGGQRMVVKFDQEPAQARL